MNDLISRAEAIAAMKEECWKDREMKLSDRIERRLAALPAVSQPEASRDWRAGEHQKWEKSQQPQSEAEPVASQISTIEAVYSNMPDVPNLPDAYQPRNIAAALRVYHAARPTTPAPVVPAEGLKRAPVDEAKAGWVLDMELLKEVRSDAGDWGCSLDLEAVEAIALEVEKRLRAQQPAAPVNPPHEFYLGTIDKRVAELSDTEVWQLCLDGDEFERAGRIGDCLLRREAEAWLDRTGLAHDHVAMRMIDFAHAAHKRRSIQKAAPVSGVTVKPGIIERAVWSAMIWAASNNAGFDGVPEYTDRGNSFAEDEARRAAARILSALEGK